MLPLRVSDGHFKDTFNRCVLLRGINLSGDSKLPSNPDVPSHMPTNFWETEHISFAGRPFPLKDADLHLSRISSWGYNVVRFVVTWEAIEHAGPNKYDEDYISYVLQVLAKCSEHNLYVIMDPHQDAWSRYSGGSGAPFWTYIAAGIDPKTFQETQAAIVHNTSDKPGSFPTMIWSTNYDRMAAATMFILFFAGRDFAPRAVLDGQNIQDFLQTHYIKAMAHLARRIHETDYLDKSAVLGWETMNEPSMSWLGCPDLSKIPAEQRLRTGTCPTPFQAIATASGIAQNVELWDFGSFGPKKIGSVVVNPQGRSIWFDENYDDSQYGWHRASDWQLGTCLWEQHGVWDSSQAQLLKPEYFLYTTDGLILDNARFLDKYWMKHFRDFKSAIRKEQHSAILFCQPPVLKVPPIFNSDDRKDSQIVYSPHYYDGLTLMTKSWNPWFNVDVLGILRGRYLWSMFAVKFGLKAIRNSLKDQLLEIRNEGLQNLGQYPCVFSEIGIPFDLDNKKAYVDGDYSSQISALDANSFALERANVGYTFWHYSAMNDHQWGDYWNGEDLSFVSSSPGADTPSGSRQTANAMVSLLQEQRATRGFVRPAPISTVGTVEEYGFDLKACSFKMVMQMPPSYIIDVAPTLVFLPHLHFPNADIRVSEGRTMFLSKEQTLEWWHEVTSVGKRVTIVVNNLAE